MKTLIKLGVWIKKYWYIPAFLLATLVTWFMFRRTGPPFKQTVAEVKAIQAEAEAAKLQEIVGTERAKVAVTEKYQAEIEQLDYEQVEQAKELNNDPAKLAKFLVRASKR